MMDSSKKKSVFVDLRTDFGFKKVLLRSGNEELLLGLINSVFREKNLPLVSKISMRNSEHVGFDENSKRVIQDLECLTEKGEKIIVEMQQAKEGDFKDRVGFYGMRSAMEEIKRGEEYHLTPVYVICLMDFVLREGHPSILHLAQMQFSDNNETFLASPTFLLVELEKFHLQEGELKNDFEEWVWNFNQMGSQLKEPKFVESNKMMNHLYQEARLARFNKEEQRQYLKNLEEFREMKYALKNAIAEGLEKGRLEGVKKGIEQGREEGREEGLRKGREEAKRMKQNIAQDLLSRKLPIEEVAKITGLGLKDLQKLVNH